MKRLLALFSGLIFLVSCTRTETPAGLLEREKMIAVLTDVHMVEAYSGTVMDADSMKQVLADYMNLVYQKHQTDSVQFRKSLKYYSRLPKELNQMYDQVVRNLETQQNELKKERKKEPVKKE
ncbi:MAG TPA: DUF4296 domain-containing protein [Sphingobacteriaceae bacterium]